MVVLVQQIITASSKHQLKNLSENVGHTGKTLGTL